ncbi:Vacuolar amino acid transporter 5 [Golovinomyces cichoracearum]|uniref:Vacuolar amino acid transporter 5 n=1 Tax=Golovinomyces cichoracearum TaxID=62708 RepID=A0A420I9S7_9PEZI|nr:Vacuolar amino acid transporter 5 [Golovinomyces cichoracearum]
MARTERHVKSQRANWDEASSNVRYQNSFVGASSISCIINLLNTIIGSGLLASPRALSQMGILVGTIVILWSGLAAAFGLYLQARCARYIERGNSSFFALSKITYPNAAVLFDAAIAIKCFGVGVSYLIIIGDLMPGVMKGFLNDAEFSAILIDRKFWITAFMLFVIPLSFLRRLDSLKYTSVVALVSISYIVILIIFHFFKNDTLPDRGEIRLIKWAGVIPTLRSFPVMVFAYTCHQNKASFSTLAAKKLVANRKISTTTVIATSIGTAAFLYTLVAITGYLSFGNEVSGNIVGMYPPSTGSIVGKSAIVLLSTFSFPLQVHPCRASVDAVLRWRPIRGGVYSLTSLDKSPSRSVPLLASQNRQASKSDTISEPRLAFITTVIIVLSYVVSMTISSLDKVLAYVGSTGSTSISFILPGLFYYKISSPDSIHHQRLLKEEDDDLSELEEESPMPGGLISRSRWKKMLRKLSLALAIYGFVVMGVCLGINLFGGATH